MVISFVFWPNISSIVLNWTERADAKDNGKIMFNKVVTQRSFTLAKSKPVIALFLLYLLQKPKKRQK